jgi:hypothetical protein
MALVTNTSVNTDEILNRIGQLQARYSKNPLVKRIEYRIGSDWSDDPAVFIDVTVARKDPPIDDVLELSKNIQADLLLFVRSDEIGVHSYLNFLS